MNTINLFNTNDNKYTFIAVADNFEAISKGQIEYRVIINSSNKVYDLITYEYVGEDEVKQQLNQKQREIFDTNRQRVLTETQKIVDQLNKLIPQKDEVKLHHKVKRIRKHLKKGHVPFLIGPAGTGKNFTCEMLARQLGLKFYYQNTITSEYKLTGFVDAKGEYQQTPLYKAMKEGGLFMLDEVDASCASALICINSLLANGYFIFPNGELLIANKNFKCICAGNTAGTGRTIEYQGRVKIDGATLDRFIAIFFGYDKLVEEHLIKDKELLEFFRQLRKVKKVITCPNTIAGLRGMKAIQEMMEDETEKDELPLILQECLWKAEKLDNVRMLVNGVSNYLTNTNKYLTATYEYIRKVENDEIELF